MKLSERRWIIVGVLLLLAAAFLFWWGNLTGNGAILGLLLIVITVLASAVSFWLPYPSSQARKQPSATPEPDREDGTSDPPSN
jgi:hypothetical protein